MSTAEDGGATANATTSSYGGGGAGGKFRKKPLRRQTTPYDRPPTNLRANNTHVSNSSSWLKKLVVEPAFKLADRFFGFRRSLPPPPPHTPTEPPEANAQESDGGQRAGLNNQGGDQKPRSGQCSRQINTSSSSGFAELEHLLNQKTFTRSEVAHLTELLQSQATEMSPEDANQTNVVSALDTARQKEVTSYVTEGNRNDGVRTSVEVFTPVHNSKVLENDIASPAELARAYMGSRPSQISPSRLGMRNQLGRESTGLLPNTLIGSNSPAMTVAKKTCASLGAVENGFVTPRSRGRSAIYNMARTPYSRVHPTSILKGSGINHSGAGPSTSSSSFSPIENDENFNSRSLTLKRRSSVLNDEVGSVGPMRRIRQKPNLLAPRFHHNANEVRIGSQSKQKAQLNAEERNVFKKSGENDDESVPSSSYAYVPAKSREVAAKILQQLEKFSPNEKSLESKIVAVQEKSPSSSRLPGRALRIMEDVDSSPQKQGKAEQNQTNISFVHSSRQNPTINNDSAVSLKSSTPGIKGADFVVKNGISQPQKKRAFRMNAEEDSLERDDVECNGLASKSLPGNKGPHHSPHTKPAEESKTTIQSEDRSSEETHGAIAFGQATNAAAVSASEGTRAASESQIFVSSFPVSGRAKEANTPFSSFSSKSADKVPSFPSESIKRVEIRTESSTSSPNVSISIGSEVRTSVKAVDTNGKYEDVSSAALSKPLVTSFPPVSFSASSFSDMNRVSTGSAPQFTTSTSITNSVPTGSSTSTTAPSSGNIFGFATNLSSGVSAAPTVSFLGIADLKAKFDVSPSSTVAERAATSSGNGIFKLSSTFGNSTGNSLQGSLFASATKSQVSGDGNISQGKTIEPASTAFPAINTTTGSSLGSLTTPSISFGLSSTSSPATTSLIPAGGPTPSVFKFGESPSATNTVASSCGPSASLFGFGGASVSSSPATNTVALSSGPAAPIFGFSSASASSSPATNTIASSSGPAAPFGFGGASVSSSPATNTVTSSSGPAAPIFGFGSASVSSTPATNTVASSSGPAAPIFGFGAASATSTASSFTSGTTSGIFAFGANSSASFSTANSVTSGSAPSNGFGSTPKFPLFGSTPTSASPSTTFPFSASTNAAAPTFSFTSASVISSPSLPNTQPIFGGGGFAASPGNSNQMNAEDSMAEDPMPSSASVPLFGQPSISPSPPTFAFGSNAPSQNNPFMYNSQQNQVSQQNPSPFQASGSLEFNAGGSFSLGSGGGDKSGRRIVRASKSKNRKK